MATSSVEFPPPERGRGTYTPAGGPVPPARPAHPKGAGQVTMHRNGRASEDAPDASAYRSGSDRFHLVRMHADAGQSPWCEGGWNSYDSLATARSAPISTSVLMKLHEIPSTGCRRPGGGHLSDDLGRRLQRRRALCEERGEEPPAIRSRHRRRLIPNKMADFHTN
jgi:hypothetical protein